MAEDMNMRQLVAVAQNLKALADAYRDGGKYLIAESLYQRALATLQKATELENGPHPLLFQILEGQAVMLRKTNS